MLASLKRVLQGDRNPAEERVTSRKKIIAILRQLKADHELLCVSVPGCKNTSNTALLGLKEDRGHFYLDELNSCDAHEALLKTRKARIQCRLRGTELVFTAQLLKNRMQDGIALYTMAIPGSMVRVQRRQNFRLHLGAGLMVPVTIPRFEGERVSGEAFDLSACGLGAFFRTRNLPNRGQVLSGLSIALPGSQPLKVNVEVRFARLDSAHHMLRMGGRFINLDRKQERQLAQFLAEQQRKRRRYEPR